MHMVWRRIDRWGGSSVEGEDRGCRHMSTACLGLPGFDEGPSYLQAESELRFFFDIPRNLRNIGEFPLLLGLRLLNNIEHLLPLDGQPILVFVYFCRVVFRYGVLGYCSEKIGCHTVTGCAGVYVSSCGESVGGSF